MSDILLSICISTFNRAAYIGETLDSILPQATDEVEIVVVDGGSKDGTESIVRKYVINHPRLRYHRQHENQGVDRDFNHAVSLARGTYCWFFTDDDLLKPNAIGTVLSGLSSNPGLLIVNSEIRNRDFSEVLQERALSILEDRIYSPEKWTLFFPEVAGYMSFIGGIVIRKEIWDRREKEKYFGTEFIHAGVIFQAPLGEDIVVLAEPLISIRYGNAQWTPRSFEIWMFKWPMLIWSFPGFTDSEKSRITQKEPWRILRELIACRAKGCYSHKEYNKWLAPRLTIGIKKALAMAISLIPGFLVNHVCLFYYSIIYKDARQFHLDLVNSRFHHGNILPTLMKQFKG